MRSLFDRLSETEEGGKRWVLIEGRRGSGRRFLAKEIHSRSKRRDRPFLVHDCRSRGSLRTRRTFLGEVRELAPGHFLKYLGLLEEVRNGTLYLEGVERLPREIQEALCEVLRSGRFSPIGSDEDYPFRGRLIVSSENLEAAANRGNLDANFYDVLSGASITVSTSGAEG